MDTARNKAVVARFDELGDSGGDLAALDTLCTPDMVVQFGTRELTWPGATFRGIETPAGTATKDAAFAYRLIDGWIAERWAIRDDLSMLVQLRALDR
jgi:ketosteroid isomerase-like protein